MTVPELLREDAGAVRILTLDRPPSNALTLALLESLERELAAARRDASVRAVVLASAVPKYFSSGLDLEDMFSLPEGRRRLLFDRMISAHRALASLGKPTVAAIEGYALLGGFILTLGCDWRLIAEESGRVALSEVRLGLSPTTALVRLASALTGRPGLVKELVLKGSTLRAKEAFEAGLADRLLPAAGFREEVVREARGLAKLAPAAYAAVQRSLRRALLGDEDALWAESGRELAELLGGAEALEGLSAAKEKRRPRWE